MIDDWEIETFGLEGYQDYDLSEYTCYACAWLGGVCRFAWDLYNIDGDCLWCK